MDIEDYEISSVYDILALNFNIHQEFNLLKYKDNGNDIHIKCNQDFIEVYRQFIDKEKLITLSLESFTPIKVNSIKVVEDNLAATLEDVYKEISSKYYFTPNKDIIQTFNKEGGLIVLDDINDFKMFFQVKDQDHQVYLI